MTRPLYEALDHQGLPYTRPAAVIGEISDREVVSAALTSATHAIAERLQMPAQRRIGFGTPVHVAFGLSRQQAKGHAEAKLLLMKGDSVPLDICPQFNATLSAPTEAPKG